MSKPGGISKLIEALQIFAKYADPAHPTNCSHDVLCVCVDKAPMSFEDIEALDKLGFFWSEEFDAFASFKYGSC